VHGVGKLEKIQFRTVDASNAAPLAAYEDNSGAVARHVDDPA